MPQISVIVPIYKVEDYLSRCIDSILAQSFSDLELILVDDGSPDRCGAICDEYAKKDSRIVVIHQKNGGLSAARNAGIDWTFANSDSQWLSFIDSDDWVHPEYLERLYNAAVSAGASLSLCGHVSTEGQEPLITPEELEPSKWETETFFDKRNVDATVAWAKLYRKECFETLRYPVGKLHEDEFTTYKILFNFESVVFIQAPLYYYYFNQSGIMNTAWSSKRLVAYDALEEQIAFFEAKGAKIAQRNVIRRYLMNISRKLKEASQNSSIDAQSLKILKKKRKKNFAYYAKRLDPSNENDAWVLTRVFPTKMKFYWYFCAVRRKLLKKTGGKGEKV